MFNKKSEYAQNKREKDSIIYISVNGRIRLTRADFSNEEEFLRWKQWSDEDYYYAERKSVTEIASLEEVTKASVSLSLARAIKKISKKFAAGLKNS